MCGGDCDVLQLYKVELERDQLQQSLVTSKQRQEEELEALQKSHKYVYVDALLLIWF